MARLYTELNKISKAKMLLLRVLKARPDWLQARFALALAAVGLKEPKLAMNSFKLVLEKHPENFEVFGNIGNLHLETKDYVLAKDYYQQALQINPNYEEAVIGFIAAVLPKAKIVHCKCHPMANCLSIYKADFRTSHGYAFNQKELAEYHNLYEDLMEHWRTVLPGRFYEIKYEDLTPNQEETRKLIEYCGLEWEDACLDFHKNKRVVKTASAYQVRQKMHSKSIDLWKHYGNGLKPLIDNLHISEEYQELIVK